jgi:hypothetical protein
VPLSPKDIPCGKVSGIAPQGANATLALSALSVTDVFPQLINLLLFSTVAKLLPVTVSWVLNEEAGMYLSVSGNSAENSGARRVGGKAPMPQMAA